MRGDEQIGTLTSQLEYVNKNDTFRYVNTYNKVTFNFDKIPSVGELSLYVPRLDVVIRVDRDGQLQEQSVRGTLELRSGEETLYTINEYIIQGTVQDGVLVGDAKLKSSLFSIERELATDPRATRASTEPDDAAQSFGRGHARPTLGHPRGEPAPRCRRTVGTGTCQESPDRR